MKKMLVVNVPGLHNLGGMAIVFGAIKSFEKSLSDTKISFVSSHFEDEHVFYDNNFKDIELLPHFWYKEYKSLASSYVFSTINLIVLFLRCILYRYIKYQKSPYDDYDIIVDLNSDALNQHYSLIQPVFSLFNIWLPLICEKKVVIAASSIGTFDNKILRLFAIKVLSSTNLILAREKRTKKYLLDIGIPKDKVRLVGDHAFLMSPIDSTKVDSILEKEGISSINGPIIGISPSELISKYAFNDIKSSIEKYDTYKKSMINIIEYMVETIGASVLIIPHSYQSTENDQTISSKIYEKVNSKNSVFLLKNRYNCTELKGLIGKCEMFIGCRMHSTIASTSMCIPTIALVYGHKSHGILGECLGMNDFLVPMEKYDNAKELNDDLISMINRVWDEKHIIKNNLKEKIPSVKEATFKNGQYIMGVLNES